MELAALVLHGDDDICWEVGDADGRISGVDGLTTVATGSKDVDAEVFGFDLQVFFFGFGEDGDGNGAGVDATLAFGDGDALDAVDATFEFELGVGLVAGNTKNNFFVAASVILVFGLELDFKVVDFGISLVHTVEFGGKEGSFVAAGAGADFDDGGFVVVGIFGGKKFRKLIVDRV